MLNSISHTPVYKRILLKLSGEALQGNVSSGIDATTVNELSREIAQIVELGVEVGIVVGGGNLIRGSDFALDGIDRVTADQMGMLATIINGLALRDAFEKNGLSVKVMSAIAAPGIVTFYNRTKARNALAKGKIIIFVGGTGNPLVTTDSAAALRGIELGVEVLLKATKVDGVFAADPVKNPNAVHYNQLKYQDVIDKRLEVMDLNSILLCQDHSLPLRVFSMSKQGALLRLILGEKIGTLIQGD